MLSNDYERTQLSNYRIPLSPFGRGAVNFIELHYTSTMRKQNRLDSKGREGKEWGTASLSQADRHGQIEQDVCH